MSVVFFDPSDLGPYRDQFLDAGGQGKVFGVPTPPGGLTGEYVYKEYLPDISVSADLLERMAGFLDSVEPADRRLFDSRLAWPLALGRRDGRLTGFLMRRVPTAFFIDIAGMSKAQSMQYLLNAPSYQRGIGLRVDDAQRLELLKDLAVLIARLHRHDVAVGDLSPKNVLFTLVGRPRCLLIDCDSMRYRGQSVVEQVETVAWEVPGGEEKATPHSDALKFGRLAVRIFNGDQDSLAAEPLAAVSPALADLARRSGLPDPGDRPAVDEWVEPLEYALDRMLDQPPPPDPGAAPAPGLYAAQSPPPPSPPPFPPPFPPVPVPPAAGRNPGAAPAAAPVGSWPTFPHARPPQRPGKAKGVLSAVLTLAVLGLVGLGIAQADGGGSPQNPGLSATQDPGLPASQTTDPGVDSGVDPGADPSTDSGADDSSAGSTDTTDDGAGVQESTAPDLPADQVAVDASAVAGEPGADAVAGMFSRFYGAINVHDYDTALSSYDPATTTVDVGDDASRARWKHTMSTTEESQVVLTALADSGSDTMASVTFRSHQGAGYGPAGAVNERCTDWSVTYQLTDTDGDYRILKASRGSVAHTPC